MQDSSPLNDPRLEALARELAAAPPRLASTDRDALIYECGFAAGRQTAMRGVRRWSVAAACLAIMAGGIGLMSIARREQPPIEQVVKAPEVIRPIEEAPRRNDALPRRGNVRSSSTLLAGASWAQVREALESPLSPNEIIPIRDMELRRSNLRVGSILHDLDLPQ